jgi:hypothetical protein
MSLVSPVASDLQLQIALADSLLSCIPAKVKFQEFSFTSAIICLLGFEDAKNTGYKKFMKKLWRQ